MTEFETKELELFNTWYSTVDKFHKQYKLQYEEAWFARAQLNETYSNISNNEPTEDSNTD